MRINELVKVVTEKAFGSNNIMKNLTEHVIRLTEKDVEIVIREHKSIILENDVFDRFIAACDAVEEPNEKLREAMEFVKEQEIK